MFKRSIRNKGSAGFEKGIWVTKHPWNDNHVVLSTTGPMKPAQSEGYRQRRASADLRSLQQRVSHGVTLLKES